MAQSARIDADLPHDSGRKREHDERPRSPAGGLTLTTSPRLWVPLCVAASLVVVVLGAIAHSHPVLSVDVNFTTAVQRIESPVFQRLMVFISALGYPPWAEVIEAAALVVLLLLRRRWEALFLALTLLADGAAALIKVAVSRPRPSPKQVEVLLRLGSFSFPSGHVVHFTVFYGFLAVILVACWRSSWWRNTLIAVCVALIALVGLSRIYLGEHWLTDVIAGYLIGGVFLVALVAGYERARGRRAESGPPTPGGEDMSHAHPKAVSR